MATTTGQSRSMFLTPSAPGSPDASPYPSPYFLNYFLRPGWPPSPYGGGPYVAPSGMYAAPYGYPGFFPPGPPALMPPESDGPDPTATPASTSTALVRVQPVRRDTTPASYPTPPHDDPENLPIPIHPYLYHVDCPVEWDLRTNFRHSARRVGGVERLSSIALKAPAFNDAAVEEPDTYKTMRIIFADAGVPWTITFTKERAITVQEVLGEIAQGMDERMTDSEMVIAQERQEERYKAAEAARAANEGTTGAVKTRPAGDSMRRVDWLGRRTRFRGFVHSSASEYEELVQRRVHAHARANTWILVLEDREDAPQEEGALVVAGAA